MGVQELVRLNVCELKMEWGICEEDFILLRYPARSTRPLFSARRGGLCLREKFVRLYEYALERQLKPQASYVSCLSWLFIVADAITKAYT